jgi:hypothetical protein
MHELQFKNSFYKKGPPRSAGIKAHELLQNEKALVAKIEEEHKANGDGEEHVCEPHV